MNNRHKQFSNMKSIDSMIQGPTTKHSYQRTVLKLGFKNVRLKTFFLNLDMKFDILVIPLKIFSI